MNIRVRAAFCLVWLATAGFIAAQTITPEAIEHARAGMDAQKKGDLETAIREFHTVTELQPTLAAGHVNLGAVYMAQRNYGQAIAAFKRALTLDADLLGAEQMLGTALLATGKATEAIPHLERAKSLDLLGIAYLEVGQLPDAIRLLGTALNQHPDDPDLLYYFGRAAGLASKASFDTLLSSAPDSARGHQALAEQYEQLRQPGLAEKEYRAALKVRADLPGLHLELGRLLAAAGNWPGAEFEFREESKLRPAHAETAWRLGSALLQQGKAADALKALELSDRLEAGMPETLFALGKAASLTGDTARAEKSWTQLLTVEKETSLAAQAHFELATLYRKAGKTADADRELAAFRKLRSPTAGAPK